MPSQSEQLKILKRFNEQANKLAEEKFSSFGQESIKISATGSDLVHGKVQSNFPHDDIVKLFLMDFRFFYIKDKNPYNFEKICNFFIENNFEKEKTKQWLDVYKKVFLVEDLKLRVGDKELTTKNIFSTIFNEENFHQEGSQKGMDYIKLSPIIEPMARMKFFRLLGQLRSIIGAVNKQIVEKYLETH